MNNIYLLNFNDDQTSEIGAIVSEKFPNTFRIDDFSPAITNDNKQAERSLVLLNVNGNQDYAKIKIWQLQKSHPEYLIVLCDSDAETAYLAWKSGVFYFLRYPFSETELMRLAEKIVIQYALPVPKIKFNHKHGFTLIDPEEICFCKSDGNYTEIFMKGNRKVVITKKLKELDDIFRDLNFLHRIGKGHIVNLKRINRIHNHLVTFDGLDLAVKFSNTYLNRIKSALLWFV